MSRKRSHSASTRDETIILRSKPKSVHQTFVVGDKVQAQWKDKRWYEAKVIKVDKNDGTFTVRFLEDKIVREGLTVGQVRYVTKKETLALFDNMTSEEESEEKEESEEESEDTEDSSLVITRKLTRKNDIVSMKTPPKLKQASAPKLKSTAGKSGKGSNNNSLLNNNDSPNNNKGRSLRNASPSPTKNVHVLIETPKEKANTSAIRTTRQTASAQKEKPKTKVAQSKTPVSTPQRALRSGATPQKGSNKKNNKQSEEDVDDGDDEDHVEASAEEEEEESSIVSEQLMQSRVYTFTVTIPVERVLKSAKYSHEISPKLYQKFIIPLLQELSK